MKEQIPHFLEELLQRQYGIAITQKIIQGYSKKRKVTFRINTLKAKVQEIEKEFIQAGIKIEKVDWSKQAYVVESASEREIQKLDCYQRGEIYLQSLSSMLPPIILQPQPEFDILDMTAAPGGKTTQLASLTNNQAHITACEKNPIRAERLKYNIEKQGANGIYVMIKDASKLEDFFSFDQILLDAPCSGSGTLFMDESHLEKVFTEKLIEKSTQIQLALLKKAIQILKPRKRNGIFDLFYFSM